MARTPQHICWQDMKQRCNNPKDRAYKWYGAKGITYHSDFETFLGWWKYIQPLWEKFVAENPNETPTIDRIDSTGNYTPGNIQIISKSENSKRCIKEHGNPSKHREIPVIATCKETGKEYHFKSAHEAERQGYGNQSNITKCCNGVKHYKSAAGYAWRYA